MEAILQRKTLRGENPLFATKASKTLFHDLAPSARMHNTTKECFVVDTAARPPAKIERAGPTTSTSR